MLLLDLYCGAGGAAVGYARAGLTVVGVDHVPQPNYPFEFILGDALDVLTRVGRDFDVIHASPPCQRWSIAAGGGVARRAYPDLLTPTRATLSQLGRPFVLENVTRAPLVRPIYLCGSSFGLPVLRHRAFETSWPVLLSVPWCGYSPHAQVPHRRYGRVTYPYARHSWRTAWSQHVLPEVWPWLTGSRALAEAGQAIPPDYAQFLGRAFVRWTRAVTARPLL